MIKRIKVYRELNNHIFVILNKHLSTGDIPHRQVRDYQPPIFQTTQA